MSYKIPESVLVVMYTQDLQVLLIERADHPGFWQSVTGSKDSLEESFRCTAVREVEEETGFIVADHALPPWQVAQENLQDWNLQNIYEIYPVWRHRYAPGVIENTEQVFGLMLPAPLPPRLSPREHVQYKWLPYRAAADLCFSPSNAQAVLQVAHRLPAVRAA